MSILRKISDSFSNLSDEALYPDPVPVESPLLPVKSFTESMLPLPIRAWMKDISQRLCVPLDFVAVSAICMLGSVIGAKIRVMPKEKDDWAVTPNLWGGIVAPPSSNKTSCLKLTLQPLQYLQNSSREIYQSNLVSYEAANEAHSALIKNLKTEIKKNKSNESVKALEEALRNKPEKPVLKRYQVNDVTPEKLADILTENPNGVLLFRDEIASLLSLLDKEGNEQARSFFLEGWSGDSPFLIDRIQRGSTLIPNNCLSISGGIQPDKLINYLIQNISTKNDGLTQRFQLLVYPDNSVQQKYVDKSPDRIALKNAVQIVEKLASDSLLHFGIKEPKNDYVHFHYSADAQLLYIKFYESLMSKIHNAEIPTLLREHLNKYRSLVPSLALIFHLLDLADGGKSEEGISKKATELAIQWCDVLETHAARIYELAGNPTKNSVKKLAKMLLQKKLTGEFNRNIIMQKKWSSLRQLNEVREALTILEQHDWIIEKKISEAKGPGRPRNKVYRINPKIYNISHN
ncbi:YfjI family protein [Catalinimonas sp. 4WD22]|uniref:YfjI family protein n=1 Tax=Catalinimonas locisalis TaxID=3133978 RepID=UPI0031017AFC